MCRFNNSCSLINVVNVALVRFLKSTSRITTSWS